VVRDASSETFGKNKGMPALFRNIDCHSLPVSDLSEGILFYQALGHELIWRIDSCAGLKLGTSELVLHTDDRPMETDLLVESVEDAVAIFKEAGGSVLREPFDIEIGRCAVILDPWNNALVILDQSKGVFEVDSEHNVIGNKSTEAGLPDGYTAAHQDL
jgi:lactoylglutathione lyase